MAGVDLALDVARHVADAVEIGDRRSAEFHHQASHDLENLTFPDAPKGANKRPACSAGRKRRVYIPAGWRDCNIDGLCKALRFRLILRVLAMRYIERILQPGENLLYAGKIHWIVYLPAMILALVALAALTRANGDPTGMVWLIARRLCALVGRGDVRFRPGSSAGPRRST